MSDREPFVVVRLVLSLAAGVAVAVFLAFRQPRVVPELQPSPLLSVVGLSRVNMDRGWCARPRLISRRSPLADASRLVSSGLRGDRDAGCRFDWEAPPPATQPWRMPNAYGAPRPRRQMAYVETDLKGRPFQAMRLVPGLTLERAVASADTLLRLGLALPNARPLRCGGLAARWDRPPRHRGRALTRPLGLPVGWSTPHYQAIVGIREARPSGRRLRPDDRRDHDALRDVPGDRSALGSRPRAT
jgi:hypothetical protein